MQQEELDRRSRLGPLDWYKSNPFQAAAGSDRLEWVGIEAAHFRGVPDMELEKPASTHHMLVLHARPPREMEVQFEGVKRCRPPSAGSISLIPAGSPSLCRWSGSCESLLIFLDPALVARVATEAFNLNPARLTVPPIDGLDLPQLRAAMGAVGAELTAGGAGGRLTSESLANVLAVQLIRHVLAPRQPASRRCGVLAQGKLRAVIEYIEGHLDAGPTLEQMAAIAHASPWHFARQFKTAVGMPPHQYVIARRVERAKEHLQGSGDLSLRDVAANAGFADQSQLSRHFKRLVGVTPGRFRRLTRIAKTGAIYSDLKGLSELLRVPNLRGSDDASLE